MSSKIFGADFAVLKQTLLITLNIPFALIDGILTRVMGHFNLRAAPVCRLRFHRVFERDKDGAARALRQEANATTIVRGQDHHVLY